MVASAITFGAIVGALLGGYLTDKIGRYRVFMADMLFFVAAIACALAPNEYAGGCPLCHGAWRRDRPSRGDGIFKRVRQAKRPRQ
jgi:MFS family permease